jgi:hypothetical protein
MSPTQLTVGYLLHSYSRVCTAHRLAGRELQCAQVSRHVQFNWWNMLGAWWMRVFTGLFWSKLRNRFGIAFLKIIFKLKDSCMIEGLLVQFASSSSLIKVADYQNASIFLDLSSNTAFSGYKVG